MLKEYHAGLASISIVGQEHAALSREKIKNKLKKAEAKAEQATSRDEKQQWARVRKRNALKLRARNIVSPITTSLDFVLGSGRRDRTKPIHFGDSGLLPSAIYLGTVAATVGVSIAGSIGGWVLGIPVASPGKGALAGAKVAGGATSITLGTAAWGLSQIAALPSVAIKASANGVANGIAKLSPSR